MTLRDYVVEIWKAGVDAVSSTRLVQNIVHCDQNNLIVDGDAFPLALLRRIVVVGAGKAGAGMASGIETVLAQCFSRKTSSHPVIEGWVNVPADCVRPLRWITLHPARPAGLNEPTEQGVMGSRRILELVAGLKPDELCLVLISGGGSALLPLPVDGITLEDKQTLTRQLSRSGATIHELNAVRQRLSQVKGGGLLRAAGPVPVMTLIISDVFGDPLDVIASGPTVAERGTAQQALDVLRRFPTAVIPDRVWSELRRQAVEEKANEERQSPAATSLRPTPSCRNIIIGNNETALRAASDRAKELGYVVRWLGTTRQGEARDVGREFARRCLAERDARRQQRDRGETIGPPICFVSGGEPVVRLASTDRPRLGGRNQELALSALCELWPETDLGGIAILSGGTDGEDGPTDAAGAICDAASIQQAKDRKLDPFDSLSINDSYTFFEQSGGLLRTGPTHTNVMDVQIALVT